MKIPDDLYPKFKHASETFPLPIAIACKNYIENPVKDPWSEWEILSRGILQPVLKYLTHLLLADLVSSGRQPAHLFHRLQSVLSRPMAGHYAGFLREAARYYRDEDISSGVPELIEFLTRSEVQTALLPDNKALIGLLVDYRNLWAHGKMTDEAALNEALAEVRRLTAALLHELRFLENYELILGDGLSLMGGTPPKDLPEKAQPVAVLTAGGINLRPLLLKLKGKELALLEDSDLQKSKLLYRGHFSHHQFKKKDLKKREISDLFEALSDLMRRVRAMDAVVLQPDWETFKERAAVVTDRTLSHYADMNKYRKEWYVPRNDWEGEGSIFDRFINSDKTLLAISGGQGTGKSALVCRLVEQCRDQGHTPLLYNAQRFSFTEVDWSGNPYPDHFAGLLHYGSPLDHKAVKRIIKSSPENKKTVLFIDAVNEVDGIENKWNRFRAMDLLLEWITQISQPGLKIVISFRLEVYEEYGYLPPEEWPDNLMEISWPGNHPRKPWVTELDDFGRDQAKSLFERLQKEPQYGMAPAMDWSTIISDLGETLNEYVRNPLIFSIFLKIHHRETKILTANKEEMFALYAEKITGARERSQHPLPKRLWYLLKDGNITPKQKFLANAMQKMSEEGGAAFLVERLNPDKKNDKRLISAIDDPKQSCLQDLKEGGMLTEENIEVKIDEKPYYSRRISFVGELLMPAFQEVNQKILARWKLLDTLKTLAAVTLILAVVFGIAKTSFYFKVFKNYSVLGDASASWFFDLAMNGFFKEILLVYLGLCVIFITTGFKRITFMNAGFGDPISAAIEYRVNYTSDSTGSLIAIFLIFSVIIVVFTELEIGGYNNLMQTISLQYGFGILGFCIWFLAFSYPKWILLKASDLKINPRLLKNFAQKKQIHLKSSSYSSVTKFNVILCFCVFVPCAILFFFFVSTLDPLSFQKSVESETDWQAAKLASILMSRYLMSPFYFGGLFILSLFLFVGTDVLSPHINLPLYKRLERHPFLKPITHGKIKLTCIVVLGSFLPVLIFQLANLVFFNGDLAKSSKDYRAAFNAVGLKNAQFYVDDSLKDRGPVTNLDLTDCNLDKDKINFLYRFDKTEELWLPKDMHYKVDLSRFPDLKHLSASPGGIKNVHKPEIETLSIYNPGNWLNETRGNRYLITLRVYGKVEAFGDFRETFPALIELVMYEKVASHMNQLKTKNVNLKITIKDEKPTLTWLKPDFGPHILELKSIGPMTENLHLIKRLWVEIDDTSYLKKMSALEYAHILPVKIAEKGKNLVTENWYSDFLEAVENDMPNFQIWDLGIVFRIQYDREETLRTLRKGMAQPDFLFEKLDEKLDEKFKSHR